MYAYSLRFNRQLILCVAVRQKLGGKHAASGESRRPRQQACARSIRETRSSLVSRELFSLHSGAARTAVRQACPSGHRCRQVSRGERTRESGIYSAWRQNDSNHAHSVSDGGHAWHMRAAEAGQPQSPSASNLAAQPCRNASGPHHSAAGRHRTGRTQHRPTGTGHEAQCSDCT
jgi:hypothetical protein